MLEKIMNHNELELATNRRLAFYNNKIEELEEEFQELDLQAFRLKKKNSSIAHKEFMRFGEQFVIICIIGILGLIASITIAFWILPVIAMPLYWQYNYGKNEYNSLMKRMDSEEAELDSKIEFLRYKISKGRCEARKIFDEFEEATK